MATRDFSKMTDKKLNALLNTASAKDKEAIQAELDRRAGVQAPAAEQIYENPEPLSPAEEEALKRAEEEYEAKQNGEAPVVTKITEEELAVAAKEFKEKYVGNKCQVVPFNTIEWVDGYICGVVQEKRAMKLMATIKTVDGRKLVKVVDSKLLRISEEKADVPAIRTRVATKEKEEWTPEAIEAGLAEIAGNVGRTVTIKGETEEEPTIEGRIVSIVPEKRAQTFMYRVEYTTIDNDGAEVKKYCHKVYNSPSLVLAEELDERGKVLNEAYVKRHNAKDVAPKTLEEKIEAAQKAVAEAEEKIKMWQERLEQRKLKLEQLESEKSSEGENPTGTKAEESLA